MLELRYPLRWHAASGLLLVLVLVAGLLPELFPNPLTRNLAVLDKWTHAAVFCALGAWFCGQYARSRYWAVGLALLAFGGLLELCQSLTPYRQAEWLDLLADAAGIACGIGLSLAGLGGWGMRAEQWLVRDSN